MPEHGGTSDGVCFVTHGECAVSHGLAILPSSAFLLLSNLTDILLLFGFKDVAFEKIILCLCVCVTECTYGYHVCAGAQGFQKRDWSCMWF